MLHDDGLEHLWLLIRLCLREGGRLYLEGVAWSREDAAAWPQRESGPMRSYDPARALDEVRRQGARVLHREGVAEAARAVRGDQFGVGGSAGGLSFSLPAALY